MSFKDLAKFTGWLRCNFDFFSLRLCRSFEYNRFFLFYHKSFEGIPSKCFLLSVGFGHCGLLNENLFVKLLNISFQNLVVNDVVLVYMVGVMRLKDNIQDLLKDLSCYLLNGEILCLNRRIDLFLLGLLRVIIFFGDVLNDRCFCIFGNHNDSGLVLLMFQELVAS
jgi:hypothetical protein